MAGASPASSSPVRKHLTPLMANGAPLAVSTQISTLTRARRPLLFCAEYYSLRHLVGLWESGRQHYRAALIAATN